MGAGCIRRWPGIIVSKARAGNELRLTETHTAKNFMENDAIREGIRRFRLQAILAAGALAVVLAAAAYTWSPVASRGVLLGAGAAIIGFWIIAVRLEKLFQHKPENVKFHVLTWTSLRFLLYGIALYRAYTLDPLRYHGLIGALAGILALRFVLMFFGFARIGFSLSAPFDVDESQ